MIYRYHTFGAKGKLTLVDDGVECEGKTRQGWWSHKTPYRCLDPNPVYSALPSPGAMLATIPCLIVGMCGVIVLVNGLVNLFMKGQASPMLYYSLAASILGGIGIAIAQRFSKVDWVLFPATLNGHRVMFTKNGPDTERYEDFVSALQERIENNSVAR